MSFAYTKAIFIFRSSCVFLTGAVKGRQMYRVVVH